MVLNRFPICFYQGLFTRYDFYHTFLLYCYAETKEIIYESVNLKGVVHEPKQTLSALTRIENLFRVQCIHFTGERVAIPQRIFVNDLIDSNRVMQCTWQTGVATARLEFPGKLDLKFLHKNDC